MLARPNWGRTLCMGIATLAVQAGAEKVRLDMAALRLISHMGLPLKPAELRHAITAEAESPNLNSHNTGIPSVGTLLAYPGSIPKGFHCAVNPLYPLQLPSLSMFFLPLPLPISNTHPFSISNAPSLSTSSTHNFSNLLL